jgi:hypothetical protein
MTIRNLVILMIPKPVILMIPKPQMTIRNLVTLMIPKPVMRPPGVKVNLQIGIVFPCQEVGPGVVVYESGEEVVAIRARVYK